MSPVGGHRPSQCRSGRTPSARWRCGEMLALIDKGEPHEAHPAFWAPFVVVGEGGAGR